MNARRICAAVATAAVAGLAAPSLADDFRVENKVFVGAQQQPVSQSTTLFSGGRVYDFLQDPATVAVFDKPAERFVLLDPSRQMKTEITTAEMLAFTARLHAWAENQKRPFLAFALDPKFDVTFDEKKGGLAFKSAWLNYELETKGASSSSSSMQYREFSDSYARLNAMLHPGSNPPFARMAVNAELARRQLVAQKVKLTITGDGPIAGSKTELRSQHQFTWRLLAQDAEQIARTAEQMKNFKPASFVEFSAGKAYARR